MSEVGRKVMPTKRRDERGFSKPGRKKSETLRPGARHHRNTRGRSNMDCKKVGRMEETKGEGGRWKEETAKEIDSKKGHGRERMSGKIMWADDRLSHCFNKA